MRGSRVALVVDRAAPLPRVIEVARKLVCCATTALPTGSVIVVLFMLAVPGATSTFV